MCWLGDKTGGKAIIALPHCQSESHGRGGYRKYWKCNFMLSDRVNSPFYWFYVAAIFLWHQPREGWYEKPEKPTRGNPPEIEAIFKSQSQIACDCCGGPMKFYRYDGGVGGVLECESESCGQDHAFWPDGSHYCLLATLRASLKPGDHRYPDQIFSVKKERQFNIKARRFLNLTTDEDEQKELQALAKSAQLSMLEHGKAAPWWLKILNRKSGADLV